MTEKRIVSFFNYNNFAYIAVLVRTPYLRKIISDLRLHLDHTKRVMNLGLGTYNEQKSSWNDSASTWNS